VESGPSLTDDRLELYFHRATDPLGLSDGDIWCAKRDSVNDPWNEPERLAINTEVGEAHANISPDGLTIVFGSQRLTEESPSEPGQYNAWIATRASRDVPFGEPEYLQVGPSPGTFSRDGLIVAFYVTERATRGFADIFIQTRETTEEEFGPLIDPGGPLNSSLGGLPDSNLPGYDQNWQFSPDGSTLYFGSTRPGSFSTEGLLGDGGIWEVAIAEAVPVDVNPAGDTDLVDGRTQSVLAAAILSEEGFDAQQVNPETLLFGDPLLIGDGGTAVAPLETVFEDVDGDGLIDLLFELSIPELRASGVLDVTTVEGYVNAQLMDGSEIAGRDAMTFIPEPAGGLLLLLGLVGVACCRRR
jgi:hypothetical protein